MVRNTYARQSLILRLLFFVKPPLAYKETIEMTEEYYKLKVRLMRKQILHLHCVLIEAQKHIGECEDNQLNELLALKRRISAASNPYPDNASKVMLSDSP